MPAASPPPKIACPHCQGLIKSPGLAAGSLVNCPKCGQAFRIGEPVESPKSKVPGPGGGNRGREIGDRRQGTEVRASMPQVPQPPPPPPARPPSAGHPIPGTHQQAEATTTGPPAQQTAIRKSQPRPDTLVDPNLLPPPPPVAKPKPTEVTVICQLCGTRSYAPLSKIGQEVKCPDCHTRNIVPPLKESVSSKKAQGPTLEGAEEFAMSEVFERPKYRPLVREQGEYEVLSALDPATVEHRLTVPGERPKAAKVTATTAARGDDDEVMLAPPVERVEVQHIPVNYVELDPADAMYDGRYDDGAIGDNVDPRTPDAWKKAPFVYGIVEFLFQANTIVRLVIFTIGLAVIVSLIKLGAVYFKAEDNSQILALFIMWGGIPLATAWLVAFAAAAQAILEATANGEKEVTTWPDWNVYDWFANGRFILIATIVAGLPGGFLGAAVLATSMEDPMMAAFGVAAPPVLSWLVLYPYILFSMLNEDSVFAIASADTLRSLKIASDGWIFFYMYSIVIVLLGVGAAAMMFATNFLAAACAAAFFVALLMLYFRLLGRLMWYSGQREAKVATAG